MSQTRRRFLQGVTLGTSAMVSGFSSTAQSGVVEKGKETKPEVPSGKASAARISTGEFKAQAVDFEGSIIYRPAQRPGYTAWVAPWKGPDGSLFLSFIEKRRLANPTHRPIPLDFYEAMGIPIKYQGSFLTVPDIRSESVVMQSQDQGNTWKEVGRSLTNDMHHFAYLSLADGSMIRGFDNSYVAYYAHEKVYCSIQKSTDRGNTWKDFSIVGEDHFYYPYRLLALRDGALVLLLKYSDAFGPGRRARRRNQVSGNVRTIPTAAIYYSYDQGGNWEGPVPVLSGVAAWEPEFVELPSGDLLLVNSDVQRGPNPRQIVRRQGKRFVPELVFDISRGPGPVPETVVVTSDGLLVGTRRGGPYCCSKDEGSTWYPIGGLPNSLYQPRIVQLADGRLCNFFHFGGDNLFGEVDQYVGEHVFRLEEHLPSPTTLVITRERDAAGDHYINAYSAVLRAGQKPVPEQEIKFTVRWATPNRASYRNDEFVRRTDGGGCARLRLPDFDRCIDIHRDYSVQADFAPAGTDATIASARSEKYETYRMTPTAGRKNTYDFYVVGTQLYVAKEMIEKFPEIGKLVKAFGLKPGFSAEELGKELKLGPERSRLLLDTLLEHNVVRAGKGDVYSWNEVQLKQVRPIEIADDFVD